MLEHVGSARPFLRMTGIAILLLMASVAAPAASASPPAVPDTGLARSPALPDTVAGRHLGALILAINRGDTMALQRLIAKHFEAAEQDRAFPAARAAELQQLSAMTGGLALRRVEKSSAAEIRALVQAKMTGAWYRVSIFTTAKPPDFTEPAPPYKVVGFGIDATTAPTDLAEVGLSDGKLRNKLDRLMDFLARGERFAGVVRVQRGDKLLYARAFGDADRRAHIPNRLQTRFNLASVTKMFTAVGIGQLMQAGKLGLSDPVGKILPELADSDLGRQVTIHQLLSHTSGLVGARAAMEKGLEPAATARSITEMTAAFVKAPLTSRPGQQFEYSNAGYILLGAIIERVSGETYYDYVQHHIFDAAGMHDTGFYPPGDDPHRMAIGYMDGPSGKSMPNTNVLPRIGSPANMAFSTAGDMERFAGALAHGQLLRKDLLDLFWTGVTEQPDKVEYGYGARIEQYNGRRIVWHGGGAPGVTNRFEMVPAEGVTVIVLANVDTEPEIVANKLREWLSPRRASPTPPASPPDLSLTIQPAKVPPPSPADKAFELLVSNRGGAVHAAVVDVEIKDQAGEKVEQQFVADQRLGAGETRRFRFVWTPKTKGRFQIGGGIFGPGWGNKIKFVDGLATVEAP